MRQSQWILSRLKPRVAATSAVILSLLLTAAIIPAPIQLQFHVGFAIPIFLCAWTRSRRFLWGLVICVLGVTVAKVAWGGWQTLNTSPWYFWENRTISIITLLSCAGVVHFLIGLIESTENEHRRLSTILATVPVGVAIVDTRAGTIIYNTAGGKMLGIEPDVPHNLDELMKQFEEIESPVAIQGNGHDIVRAINGEITSSVERMFQFRDGRNIVALVSGRTAAGAVREEDQARFPGLWTSLSKSRMQAAAGWAAPRGGAGVAAARPASWRPCRTTFARRPTQSA